MSRTTKAEMKSPTAFCALLEGYMNAAVELKARREALAVLAEFLQSELHGDNQQEQPSTKYYLALDLIMRGVSQIIEDDEAARGYGLVMIEKGYERLCLDTGVKSMEEKSSARARKGGTDGS